MANYKAVANGNWSDLAIWQDNSSGSFVASTVLPGASDDVYGNNFTVTIDQDITVASLRTTSATGIVQQGSFTVAYYVLTSRTIICTGLGIVTPVATTRTMIIDALNSVVNIIADVQAGNNASGGNEWAIQLVSTPTLTVNHTGNVYHLYTGTGLSRAIQINSGNTYNFTGNIYGQGVTYRAAPFYINGGTLNITGDLFVGSCVGVDNYVSSYVNHVGNINVSSSNNYAVGQWNLIGILHMTFSGNITTTSQYTISFYSLKVHPTGNISWQFLTTNAGQFRTLYTPGVATGHPAEANVRTGVVYGPTNNLTGTCAVPPANTVNLGVPVDNTTGTAFLTAADMWNVPLASITTPNSIGERLKDASTVQTTGAQLAAFLP